MQNLWRYKGVLDYHGTKNEWIISNDVESVLVVQQK